MIHRVTKSSADKPGNFQNLNKVYKERITLTEQII